MKTSLSIILVFTNIAWIFGQDKVLVDFSCNSFLIENVSMNSCILSDSLINSKRRVVIFYEGECNKTQGFVSINNDTIDLLFGIPSIVDTQYVVHDPKSGDSTIMYVSHISSSCCSDKCGYELTYLLDKEYRDKKIRIENKITTNCIDHSTFQVIKGDTINRIDKYGLKQGEWFEFFPDKKVKKREKFMNNRLIEGDEYNKQGNIISRALNEGEVIIKFDEKVN